MSNYGRPRGPVSNCAHTLTLSKCQNVKVSDTPGPPLCQILQKKVVACVNVGRAQCQILGRPAARVKVPAVPGPLCQISKKKVVARVKFWGASRPVSNYGAPRGPCQSSGRAGAPVSNLQKKGRRSCWGASRPVSNYGRPPGPCVKSVGACVKVLGTRGPLCQSFDGA